MEDFYYAGGLPAVVDAMGDLIDPAAMTISGQTLAEQCALSERDRCVDATPSKIWSGEKWIANLRHLRSGEAEALDAKALNDLAQRLVRLEVAGFRHLRLLMS